MDMQAFWPWVALLLLGAWHGINPGMGWLFAVGLGLQEQKRRAVWRALLPLAMGHGVAIAAAIAVGALAGLILPVGYLKWLVALTLIGFGLYRMNRSRHPRWGGMRVGIWDLSMWSFLMASAHGAGLMVLPVVVRMATHPAGAGPETSMPAAHHGAHGVDPPPDLSAVAGSPLGHDAHAAAFLSSLPGGEWLGLLAALVHTLAYLLVTGGVAVIVYEKLGLRLLRTVWFNLDLVWAATLILTGALTPLL